MKKLDRRVRKALIKLYVERNMMAHDGFEQFTFELIGEASLFINKLADRMRTDGLDGSRKNYAICQQIAGLQIKLEQAKMVWSTDNIDTFDRVLIKGIEGEVRAHRAKRPPRKERPRCKTCGRPVDTTRPFDFSTDGPMYTCVNCID
jgi:hypothetical protein